jgi:hypothetical protein
MMYVMIWRWWRYCILVNFEGDDDLDSFSWNHVLISSFQAPRSIHDRDISSNLNQHNNTTFDSNQQHDMYNSSTTDSYERLLKQTSRMIQSIRSLYDTPPQATEQKSSASSSSLSSSYHHYHHHHYLHHHYHHHQQQQQIVMIIISE